MPNRKLPKRLVMAVLAVCLVLTIVAISQYHLRVSYELQLEADYSRAFRELAVHVELIDQKIAKSKVASSQGQQAELWADIQRLVYVAQSNLGQLPISYVDLGRIKAVLDNLRTKAQEYAHLALADSRFQLPIDEIDSLSKQASYLNRSLQQTVLGTSDERWVKKSSFYPKLSTALRWGNRQGDRSNPLLQSLIEINDGLPLEETSEENRWSNREDMISPNEAISLARQFLYKEEGEFEVINEGYGTIPTFTVQVLEQGKRRLLEISRIGGHVLWMVDPSPICEGSLGTEEMEQKAREFLKTRGFPDVELLNWQFVQNRGTFEFIPIYDQVLIYPERVIIQVGADNGDIVGTNTKAFYGNQRQRSFSCSLTEQEARRKIANTTGIKEGKLAYITTEGGDEVLTYRFLARLGEEEFHIFVNAENGVEEQITPLF